MSAYVSDSESVDGRSPESVTPSRRMLLEDTMIAGFEDVLPVGQMGDSVN
jgi:hypothetical protein